jgi:molybdopterin converting factor small subunit
MTDITTGIPVTVRFFAAAAVAAGRDSVALTLPRGSSIHDALGELSGQSDEMALVLQKCSYLCDGVAVRDRAIVLRAHQNIDVLPPFAGG